MDELAVASAYRQYAPAIWRRCFAVLRSEASAMDVTQEVFVRCFHHRRNLRVGRELLGWLHRVATNLCLNELRDRRMRGHPAGDGDEAAKAGAFDPDLVREPAAVARLLTAEVLLGLDRRSQEVAFFVHVDGLTHAEAAQLLRLSERTVRNCLARFREHGRSFLQATIQEET